MNFAEKLKMLRKQQGLSQPALAGLVGVSTRTIAGYETEGSYPRRQETYKKLAEALNTDINFLKTEHEDYMTMVGAAYGRRGQEQAAEILRRTKQLFAGGSLSPEDEIAFLHEIQSIFLDSKKRAKRFAPGSDPGGAEE